MSYLNLPILFIVFWFYEAPVSLIKYFLRLDEQFLHIFSLPLAIRTLFKPWKNEYRKGYVIIAICIGFVIKSFLIIADLVLLILLLIIQIGLLTLFLLWPVFAVSLLIK